MSYRPRLQLSPPSEWPDFETLCWGLWKVIWGDDNTRKHGRRGQSQHGVDIYGQPGKGSKWAGVQCKGKENFTNQTLTQIEINTEIKKAKKFKPKLSEYLIATTAPRDTKLQELARNITDEHEKTGWFKVVVHGWDDIVDLLYEHEPPIARLIYPCVFDGKFGILLRQIVNHLPESERSTPIPQKKFEDEPKSSENVPIENLCDETSVRISIDTITDTDMRMRAKDVQRVITFLSAIQIELLQQSEKNGSASSDTTLSSAIKRATGNGGCT